MFQQQQQQQSQNARTMSYKRLPKVLGFYELPDEIDEYLADVNRKLKVKCKFCPKSIVGSVRVTSNFITHLKKTHQKINAEYELEKKSNFELFSKRLKATEAAEVKAENKLDSVENSRASNECIEQSRKERIDALLVKFISTSSLNSSVVLNSEFVSLAHELCPSYEVPSLAEITGVILPDFVSRVSEAIRRLLDECDSVSLSVDTWTEPLLNRFFGINAHFIDKQWKSHSALLGCARLSGPLHSRALFEFGEEMADKYSIAHKVASITFDSTSQHFSSELSLFESSVSLEKKEQGNGGYETMLCENEIDSMLACEDSEFDESRVKMDWSEKRMSCVLHALHSCVKDTLKPEILQDALSASLQLINNSFKLNWFDDVLNKDEIPPVKIKWCIELSLLRSLLKHGAFLSKPLDSVIAEFISVLEPLEEVASLWISEISPVSNCLPCYRGLVNSLLSLSLSHCEDYRNELLQLVKKRLGFIEEKSHFAFAAMLNPNFGLLWCSSEEERKWELILIQSIIEHVKKHCEPQFLLNQGQETSIMYATPNQSSSVGSPTSSEPSRKRLKVFEFMKKNRAQTASKDDSAVVDSVKEYLEELRQLDTNEREVDLFEYWKSRQASWPELSSFARHLFQIAAVSFSHQLTLKDCAKDFDDDFENLNFLKVNNCFFSL